MTKQSNRFNWAFIVGAAVLLLSIIIALFGPLIAPRDPLERVQVVRIGEQWVGPPFPPFATLEYPLGSDRFGRDNLSRLLWAIRPTFLLVIIVASVRLVLGVIVGMAAGWFSGRLGKAWNSLLDTAAAIPAIIISLAALAVIGIERGLPAFIIGMSLNGWTDTAQTVRAQTRTVRSQAFMEAARALGAGNLHLVLRHILRHILPLTGMLFAFEMSATLLLTAALGFLGYYIGGGVWIVMSGDAIPVAERTTGLPELGQLVATAIVRLSGRPPWEMLFPATAIFIMVLGFNLLGEGIRQGLDLSRPRHSHPFTRFLDALFIWMDRGSHTLRQRGIGSGTLISGSLFALLIVGGGIVWWQAQIPTQAQVIIVTPTPQPTAASTVGAPLWASERGDATGSLAVTQAGPTQANVAWSFNVEGGITGGPAVAADGTIYVGLANNHVVAITRQGQVQWQAPLPAPAVGTPAIAPDGTIYATDTLGGLTALSPDGTQRWYFKTTYRNQATSGPIVASDGTVYYTIIDAVQAVRPDGTQRWLGVDSDLSYIEVAPRISADGTYVFLKGSAFRVADGKRQPLSIIPDDPPFNDPTLLTGGDGANYYRSAHTIYRWKTQGEAIDLLAKLTWNSDRETFTMPSDAGVTHNNIAWLLYGNDFATARIVWIASNGQVLGNERYPYFNARLLGVDSNTVAYLCGNIGGGIECVALDLASGQQRWKYTLKEGGIALGGAILNGRLIITTRSGTIYALGTS